MSLSLTDTKPGSLTGEEEGFSPLLISGPCSAESEQQVLDTARGLADQGISYFRAGIWKPRTNPDSFAGVGKKALSWLQTVKSEFGMKTAVEVANTSHVEAALRHDVDMLWIGARTSVNPFTVQEIADALRGVKVPVMVKNPINPDLDLWVGALERILRADVGQVMACHRGFAVYGKTVLRNSPLWEIPIDLKAKFPDIPLICDPSHISGVRGYIYTISQKALDLGYEGLMIESHVDPSRALSDAKQQLTPKDLRDLLAKLRFKQPTTSNLTYHTRMQYLRAAIDEADERLMEVLAERMEISKRIGVLKLENNLPFYQYNRWAEIVEHVTRKADELGVDGDFVQKLFSIIHLESIDIQGE
ncbi:MAG: bifunctional 3-deoxy-7-phosphoheptulonate synthase/chorismate mutase type II [Bacteroidia bacterium]|nr:bifunctional 3-deoxy-7-phosphoheptulonate synthase/chorismate mutase type II [Bacteroidia bacterium]